MHFWCDVLLLVLFFFTDPATTEIYTLSLHDALPIWTRTWRRFPNCDRRSRRTAPLRRVTPPESTTAPPQLSIPEADRKSTRLNSSHVAISYAVFCLKKKKISLNSLCI